MDPVDRAIVNTLQGEFPLCERPFAVAAEALAIGEDDLIARIERMLADGTLTRFGPLFDAARMGGAFTLAAMAVASASTLRSRSSGLSNGFSWVTCLIFNSCGSAKAATKGLGSRARSRYRLSQASETLRRDAMSFWLPP